jgi:hypothetical protein
VLRARDGWFVAGAVLVVTLAVGLSVGTGAWHPVLS